MTQNQVNLKTLSKIVWTKRTIISKWAAIGAAVGVVIALSIPTQYTANAIIAPEDKLENMSGSMNMVASLMGGSPTANIAGINSTIYPDVVRSTPFLMEFAELKVNGDQPLYKYLKDDQKHPWWSYIIKLPATVIALFGEDDNRSFENSEKQKQKFVETLNDAIQISQDETTRIYTLSASFQNPEIAKEVLDTMLVKLQKYMNNYYTAKERAILSSNTELLNDAQNQYYKADERYAAALDKNHNLVSKSARVKLERLKNERDLAFQIYSQLALEVESNKLKVQDKRLITTVIEPPLLPVRASAPATLFLVVAMAMLAGFIKIILITTKE